MKAVFGDDFEKFYRQEYAPKATDAQWKFFWEYCKTRDLIPGRHCIFRIQMSNEMDQATQQWKKVPHVIIITTLEAMTLLADRTGKYDGQGPAIWYYPSPEGTGLIESQIPLGKICHAASVEVFRKDLTKPARGVARYDACVQLNAKKVPNSVWEKRGEEMTAKCARADAFRIAFPEEVGKLYIAEEVAPDEPDVQANANAARRTDAANTTAQRPALSASSAV
jgi:phage recombination protein Bet